MDGCRRPGRVKDRNPCCSAACSTSTCGCGGPTGAPNACACPSPPSSAPRSRAASPRARACSRAASGRRAGSTRPVCCASRSRSSPWRSPTSPRRPKTLWEAAEVVFQDAAADAIRRGEFLVVEPGGWDTAVRAVRAGGGPPRDRRSTWSLYVEARPAPRTPSWPEPDAGQAGSGVAAPAEPDTFATLGRLLRGAVATWAVSPLRRRAHVRQPARRPLVTRRASTAEP